MWSGNTHPSEWTNSEGTVTDSAAASPSKVSQGSQLSSAISLRHCGTAPRDGLP